MKERVYAHGHALLSEGWGYRAQKGTDCKICERREHLQDHEGHGRCKCGAQSPEHLDTNRARREWYQTHRAQYQKRRPPPLTFSQTTT